VIENILLPDKNQKRKKKKRNQTICKNSSQDTGDEG
jgi:hypothetical protein